MGLWGFKQIEPKEQNKRKNRKKSYCQNLFFFSFLKKKYLHWLFCGPWFLSHFGGAVGRCLGDRALLDFGCFCQLIHYSPGTEGPYRGAKAPGNGAGAEEGTWEGRKGAPGLFVLSLPTPLTSCCFKHSVSWVLFFIFLTLY